MVSDPSKQTTVEPMNEESIAINTSKDEHIHEFETFHVRTVEPNAINAEITENTPDFLSEEENNQMETEPLPASE